MSAQIFIADIYSSAGAGQEAILQAIRGVNKHVISEEPNARVYYWYISEDRKDGTVYGLEDYATAEDHVDVHNRSPAFLNLVDEIGKSCPGDPKLSLEYLVQAGGFTGRDKSTNAALVRVERFEVDPSTQPAAVDILGRLATEVESAEPETLSFVVYQTRDRPGGLVVFERFQSNSSLHDRSAGRQKAESELKPYVKTRMVDFYKEAGIGFMKRS